MRSTYGLQTYAEIDILVSFQYLKMASREEEVSFLADWGCDEGREEESAIESDEGEEANRPLTRNDAWNSCKKLKTDANYHQRYIPLNDALGFRDLSTDDKEAFVIVKKLTNEDKMFLSSEKAVKTLQKFSDAVVCITVKQLTSPQPAYGTGFFVRVSNNEDTVITNSHNIRKSGSGAGIDFRFVKPGDVKIISFYNGKGSVQVTREVARIESVSTPNKDKGKNVLLDSMRGKLFGNDTKSKPDVDKCDVALGLLSSYFDRRDAFLDYALLYLKPLDNEEQKTQFAKVEPLEMKAFAILENFRNVSSFGFPDPRSSTYSRSLGLFTISHPHRASKQVSFGGMQSDLTHVYFLNMAHGQNDTGMLGGKEPFTVHSIATCTGSSGAPIFYYIFNHDTGEVEVDDAVYFLHFFGESDGNLHGKAVSFSTIIRNLQLQATHKELGDALAEVRGN